MPAAHVDFRLPSPPMAADFVSGVVGAGLGAVFTAGGTWWVSVRLDRQREARRMIAAIHVVVAELAENSQRISARRAPSQVTFRDWATNKAALAGLSIRDPQ